ncbi:MAG: trypsin-like serine protease [Methanothrix sp.]|jgi:hypothetical protein|nr:trypsin-like serine protease [Methanothrix sp.]NLX39168.1 trypsin-like serine protease [Methanothrix sp.]
MLDFIKGNGSEQKSISSLSILENSIGKGYPGLNCTVHLIVILCLLYSIGSCCAVVFCPDDRYLMPINNSLPWGAIGYMDNGCTATLLDPSHIVAAAHCFCFDDTGSWQNNLSFYPNFNPKRPNSPSVAIDRAVVGTRVRTGGEFQASDWGIGHLAKEVKDFPAMQADFKSNSAGIIDVMSAGYGRDLFFFGVGQAPPGGVSKMGCNVWWQPALVDPKCRLYLIDSDQLFFDCATIGGNSGSPIIYVSGNKYYVIGVVHGGPEYNLWHGWWNIAGLQVDPGSPATVASRGPNNLDVFAIGKDGKTYTAAWGPQTNFAWKGWTSILDLVSKPGSQVAAVSRSADWLDIFAVGKDGWIYTASWNPTFTDGWHGWWKIGGLQVDPGTPLSVASKGANNLDVFAVGKDGGIYSASWGPQTGHKWSNFVRILDLEAMPGSYVQAAARGSGRLDLFVTGKDGRIYTSSLAPPATDWQAWSTISNIQVEPGSPVSIASRGPEYLDVFVVGKDGGIYTAAKGPQTNNQWQGWWRIHDLTVGKGSYIAAVSRGADKLDILVTGSDGRVYTAGWEPKFSCGWKGWQRVLDVSFKPGSYLGAASRSTDWLDIFASSSDSNIYTASWNPSFTCEACSDLGPAAGRLNVGPSAKRFIYAPKYAQNAALTRYLDGSARTQVFVTDSDSNLVVTRYRNSNSVDDGFGTYRSLGSVIAPRRIAAFMQTNGKPQVVVTSDDGKLYTKAVKKSINVWNSWTNMDLPSGVMKALDVDAAYDFEGTNQIYIIGDDGNLYTRARVNKEPDSAWKSWEKLTTNGAYLKVTALRRSDGTQQAFLVGSTGQLATLYQKQAALNSPWTTPAGFGNPSSVGIVDMDAAWTEDEQAWVFAVDQKGALWIREMISLSSNSWGTWQSWTTGLYAPDAASQQPAPEGIVSLTASRWQEETGGDIVPVVLATDNRGNVYYSAHKRQEGWSGWRSFYH